jgi:hypothetical protein
VAERLRDDLRVDVLHEGCRSVEVSEVVKPHLGNPGFL